MQLQVHPALLEVRRRLGLVRLTRRILFGQPPLSTTAPVLIRLQYATARGDLFVDFVWMHLAFVKNDDSLLFPQATTFLFINGTFKHSLLKLAVAKSTLVLVTI
jgi:hypothetical protein